MTRLRRPLVEADHHAQPRIRYAKASLIAHKADDEGSAPRESALALGVSAADFDRTVDPRTIVGDPRRDIGLEYRDGSSQ